MANDDAIQHISNVQNNQLQLIYNFIKKILNFWIVSQIVDIKFVKYGRQNIELGRSGQAHYPK